MSTPNLDELAQLRAELAVQRREIDRLVRRLRLPRRALPIVLAAFLVALIPLATLAANPFTDLNPGSPHNGNIELIYNAGITSGCDPNVAYCPSGFVTREEMASFLARTAGLGTNPPVVNAKTAQSAVTAQTATNAQNAVNAQNATNAQNAVNAQTATSAQSATTAQSAVTAQNAANTAQLGGQPPSYYHPAGQPIANATNAGNANALQGYAPNGLLRVAANAGPANDTIIVNGGSGASPRTPLIAVTIAAPGPGYVLVNGSAVIIGVGPSCDGSGGGQACVAGIRLRNDETSATSTDLATTVNGQNGGNINDSLSPVHLFTVPAAGEYEFILEAGTGSGYAGQVAAINPTITALFVPFNATGTTP